MKIIERAKAPTPKLFRLLRNIGLTLAAVGGAIVTAPVSLPALMTSFAGYLAVAGSVLSEVSQVTVQEKNKREDETI